MEIADWDATLWVTSLGKYGRGIFLSVMPLKLVLAQVGNGHPDRGKERWIPAFEGMTKGGFMLESPLFWFYPYNQLLFLG